MGASVVLFIPTPDKEILANANTSKERWGYHSTGKNYLFSIIRDKTIFYL